MANPLEGDIEIPKVGSVPKAVLVPVVAGAAAYGWALLELARQEADAPPEPFTPPAAPGLTEI